MARWTASAKWAVGPALDGQRDMPLALRLSEGLGSTAAKVQALSVEDPWGIWRLCAEISRSALLTVVDRAIQPPSHLRPAKLTQTQRAALSVAGAHRELAIGDAEWWRLPEPLQ